MNPHIFIGNPSQAFSRSNRHTANDQSYILDEEVEFPDGKLITSRTDLNGIITHANEAFVTMSAWNREELIGQPHSILRHPARYAESRICRFVAYRFQRGKMARLCKKPS